MAFLKLINKPSKSRNSPDIDSSDKVYEYVQSLSELDREAVVVLHLSSNLKVICHELVSLGTLDYTIMDPKTVLRKAVINSSAGIVLVHNHTSGELKPSKTDIDSTKIMLEAADILGIKLLDHIIVADDDFYSMGDSGDFVFDDEPTARPIRNKVKKYRSKQWD